jgi:transcriptional regulator with XRE-family HTH domain
MLDITSADCHQACVEIGTRLRAHRLAQLVTQAELARRADVSTGTVQNVEAGRTSLDSLIRVAFALGLRPDFRELFALRVTPIAQMEHAEPTKRIRAPRRGTRHTGLIEQL